MTGEEKEVVIKAIQKIFIANNKALTISLGDCPGIVTLKVLAESMSEELFKSYEILNTLLVSKDKPKIYTNRKISVEEFIRSGHMGG